MKNKPIIFLPLFLFGILCSSQQSFGLPVKIGDGGSIIIRKPTPTPTPTKPHVKIGYNPPGKPPAQKPRPTPTPTPTPTPVANEIPTGYPYDSGVDETKLVELAYWIKNRGKNLPLYSLLISKNGKLIFELYTPGLDRDDSHYLMSVTKSVLSTLIGIAIDQKKIPSEITPLDQIIPNKLFPSSSDKLRFSSFNLKDVIGMQCLQVTDPPRDNTPNAINTHRRYWGASNRFQFVLSSPTQNLAQKTLMYNDQGPSIASGILSYSTGMSPFDFGEEYLFKPLGFKNSEWMHQDPTGINMGGYGLRLRPIDMQKIGILHLQNGRWNNKQVLSESWALKTANKYVDNCYGYYWWANNFGSMIQWQVASGWKGQFIVFNRSNGVVVTMTGCIEDGSEGSVLEKIMKDYVIPAIYTSNKPVRIKDFDKIIKSANIGESRISNADSRMVPGKQTKEVARKFNGK
jgi:CubicO group peptidase (beta-lactamase class C family)